MKENIVSICQMIEESYNCKILFAVESGSRLWRFDSPDSDYDVRFVYIYTDKRKYLDFFGYSDVIEYQDKQLKIDMCGFDIKKYSKMILKSNPNMVDWTFSDIIYYGNNENRKTYQQFLENHFNPRTLVQAYRGIAMNALKDIDNGKKTIKKYLYVLRGFLSADWVIQYETLPDLNFYTLLDKTDMSDYLLDEIEIFIELKKIVKEKFQIKETSSINSYINHCRKLVESKSDLPPARKYTQESHDLLYNQMIDFFNLYIT